MTPRPDMGAAALAGAVAVGVPTGPFTADELSRAGADVVLASLLDFPEWLATTSTARAPLRSLVEAGEHVVDLVAGRTHPVFLGEPLARTRGALRCTRHRSPTCVIASRSSAGRFAP